MSSIIRATTTSGLQVAPDNSGILELQTNGTTAAVTIDTSQNVGIGITPSAWNSPIKAMQTLYSGTWCNTSATSAFYSNVYRGSGYTAYYINSFVAGEMAFNLNGAGEWTFSTAPSGTAGTACTLTERMRITSGGEVYIAGTTDRGAFNLQCNGTGVWGAGAYTNGSDARIKENITPLDTGLDVVAKLNPVTYKYKEDWSRDQSIQTGFIAQDLLVALEGKNYVDGIVNQSSEYMSVAYQNIIPILTKAIQEQQALIQSQAATINDLKARIETLEAK